MQQVYVAKGTQCLEVQDDQVLAKYYGTSVYPVFQAAQADTNGLVVAGELIGAWRTHGRYGQQWLSPEQVAVALSGYRADSRHRQAYVVA